MIVWVIFVVFQCTWYLGLILSTGGGASVELSVDDVSLD